ncbi:HAT family dimerization domain containing protein, partial [Trifolium medium]|nr:HAT family dimerization domain containing protein [Trifolium medium]
ITRMVADPVERSKIEIQLDDFDKQANHFAHPIAVITADDEIPPIWWGSSVDGQPELQSFAMRVLCLTRSSYGGRRNEKAFEMVHAKGLKEKIDNDDIEGSDVADLHGGDGDGDGDEDEDGDEDGDEN